MSGKYTLHPMWHTKREFCSVPVLTTRSSGRPHVLTSAEAQEEGQGREFGRLKLSSLSHHSVDLNRKTKLLFSSIKRDSEYLFLTPRYLPIALINRLAFFQCFKFWSNLEACRVEHPKAWHNRVRFPTTETSANRTSLNIQKELLKCGLDLHRVRDLID